MFPLEPDDPKLLAGEVDFYCSECGYNLRGLTGDPKRCPECFHVNPVADLVLTEKGLTAQLRKLKNGMVFSFAALAVIVSAAYVSLHEATVCLIVPTVLVASVLWAIGASPFTQPATPFREWRSLVIRAHCYGFTLLVLVCAAPLAVYFAMSWCMERKWTTRTVALVAVGAVCITLSGRMCAHWVRPRYLKLKVDFASVLQRIAIEKAREAQRASIRRQQLCP